MNAVNGESLAENSKYIFSLDPLLFGKKTLQFINDANCASHSPKIANSLLDLTAH